MHGVRELEISWMAEGAGGIVHGVRDPEGSGTLEATKGIVHHVKDPEGSCSMKQEGGRGAGRNSFLDRQQGRTGYIQYII